jgi:hypothetical protein
MKNKKYEIAKAAAELNGIYEFLEELLDLSPEEQVEKVAERDPDFIAHCEAMEEPPKSAFDFRSGFAIWTICRLRDKYRPIWSKVIMSYFRSEPHRKSIMKATFKDQLNQILRDTGFE